MKIIIPLNGQSESEIEGLVINDTDIRVKIGRKKGRKTKV